MTGCMTSNSEVTGKGGAHDLAYKSVSDRQHVQSVEIGGMFTRHAIRQLKYAFARLFRKSLCNLIP